MLKPLGEALAGWSVRDDGRADPLSAVAACWPDIVGREVARNSQPINLAGETLIVATRSSAWSEQLSFLAEGILASLHERFGLKQLQRLRFRAGRLVRSAPARVTRGITPAPRRAPRMRADAASLEEAVARFRSDVDRTRRAKTGAGWKECCGCATLVAPDSGALCTACAVAAAQEREQFVARLLFEVPWLGYAGVSALVGSLSPQEYEAIRARLLARWWETLVRARMSKRLSPDGRERLIASSFVIVKSGLEPERIAPATVRDLLGDELFELMYRKNMGNVE
ncbi:MAG TPA: DUF721 domain-containing protein [Candidatus Tyrphobacter sp.]